MFEHDERGKWEVTQGKDCKIRVLVKPSKSFLDWQASNPTLEPEPVVDIPAWVKDLETRIIRLEEK